MTPIFRMGQGLSRDCFCPSRRPIPHLWMFAINRQLDYPRCKTKNHWCSVDAHFQDRAGSVSLLFFLWRQPIPHSWMVATNRHFGYPRCKAKNYSRSIDAHFQNGAVTLSISVLPINAANMLVMNNSDQITFQWLYLQDQTLLMLHWRSFKYIVHSKSAAFDNSIFNYLNLLVATLPDWELSLWQRSAQ